MSTAEAASPEPAAPGGARRWRGAAPLLFILAFVVAVGAIGGRGGAGGPALDPTSTSPGGAKALALLLDQLGTGVDQATAPPEVGSGGVALVLQDRLGPDGDRQLADWARSGGTLVIADPSLVVTFAPPQRQPGPAGLAGVAGRVATDCRLPAVQGVGILEIPDGLALRPPPGATGCFQPPQGGAFLVAEPYGAGELVLLGGPGLWDNDHLGHDDNSVLAANLLAARPGTRLQWIVGPRAGGGHESLLALMSPRVKEGLVELLVAVALLALWRGRRLGRPVVETPAVEVPGSELVVAVGNLLEQGGRFEDAGAILRATLRRGIAGQLGVPLAAGPEAMAAVVAARSGLSQDLILAAIAGPPPAGAADLVILARQVDTIRQELAHAR